MKNHKTILVSCFIQNSPQAIPLAAAMLKSYTQNMKVLETRLVNFTLGQNVDTAVKELIKSDPDSIGFSMYIWNRYFFEEMAEKLKKINPAIIIYCGGAEVTASWEDLSLNSHFDYLIRGEGESPFLHLMKFLSEKSNIPFRKVLKQDHLQNLNIIPSPFLEKIIIPSEWDGVLWELSRGCPFNCSFCAESRGITGVRYFDIERIEAELKLFENNNVDQVFVLDPTFNVHKDRALSIISLIKEHTPFIHFTFEIRAELLNEELARAFSEIHCSLQIGLQSAHSDVLSNLNRSLDKDEFSSRIDLLNQWGAVFGLDLIYGLPDDTLEGFCSSLDYALYRLPNHLDIFRLSVFPGTELFEKADSLKLEFQETPPYHVLSSKGFTADDLETAATIAHGVDLFYNKGKSAPWLLSVTEALEMKPSEFFTLFTKFLNEYKKNNSTVFDLQSSFLISLFPDEKHMALSCAIDLSLYHYLYGEALHSQSIYEKNSKPLEYNRNMIYRRNNTLKQGIFSFDVTLYSELGMIDIELFLQQYTPEVSYGLIFNSGCEIMTMAVEKYLYQFVSAIDGVKSMSHIFKSINKKEEEMTDFIDFLIESELIFPVE